ncbi:hypothetical protein MHB50_01575 [Siminovitchia sp. FSL H7-0308]|uniref:Nucleic acid-binding Zn-ribbon protein n=1 Tax=Siminovitchia thermophila TaxID=1245522 RepID=A0ABS2R3T3_9BACI|nr:hypothetical protein [Siminovitchia thermophila]MBM7714045.1 putative nucleic acid-binding Zn-ribbon protein [Siminovitchia thermophila]ONK21641.1 hypothetical protein BLX87_20700 [Bacillus sp. VT-16-64]
MIYLEDRFGSLEVRLDNLEDRFAILETRQENLEIRQGNLEAQLKSMEQNLTDHIKHLETKFTIVLEELVETKADVRRIQRAK